ncbi:MAG: LamG-like jellyroll fold domain-containing protein [Gaiella sp.]
MRTPERKRSRRKVMFGLALVLAAVAAVSVAGAATSDVVTQTVPASADSYLRSGSSDTNEGGSSFLRVRASGDNRPLVRFDQAALEAALAGGTLVSASLELTITQNSNNWSTSGRTISVYRLTKAWAEGNGFVDQGSPPNRGTGAGATWECASDSNIANQVRDCSGVTQWEMGQPNNPSVHPWVEPATATKLITNGLLGTISFDVTSDVQAFLAGSAANNGWIIKKDVEGQAGQAQFASRESGGSGPRLVLTVNQASGPPVNQSPPVVSGVAADEQVLSASTGAWGGAPAAFTYQWQRCGPYSAAVTADDPVAWWRMSEPAGTSAVDISGFGNDGVYTSGVGLGQPGAPADLANGDLDTSAVFDGASGLEVGSSPTVNGPSGAFSLELWMKPEPYSGSVPLIAREVGDGSITAGLPTLEYGLVLDAEENVSFRTRLVEPGDDGPEEDSDEPTPVPPDVVRDLVLVVPITVGSTPSGWYHVVATYDGASMQVYVNGTLAGSQSAVGFVPSSEQPLSIAKLASVASGFVGGLDEVAVYLTALPAARVAAHFAASGTGCVDVAGATTAQYALTNDDRGSRIRVTVTASNASGSASSLSSQTEMVGASVPLGEGEPVEPAGVAAPPVVPPDPSAPSPLLSAKTQRGSLAGATTAVDKITVTESGDVFRFRTRDAVWDIAKRCHQWLADDRGNADPDDDLYRARGPGYISYVKGNNGTVYVNDEIPAHPGRYDPDLRYGAINAVHGGLGTFGMHYARGPALLTPSPNGRGVPNRKVIEGRQCAGPAFPQNNDFGVFAQNIRLRPAVQPNGECFAPCRLEMAVWFRDRWGSTGEGPTGKKHGLFRVIYHYRFHSAGVSQWMTVTLYGKANSDGVPFVKEPKFTAVVAGTSGFKRVAVFRQTATGEEYERGINFGGPEQPVQGEPLGTRNVRDRDRTRVQFDFAPSLDATASTGCTESQQCFSIEMRAVAPTGIGNINMRSPQEIWEKSKAGLNGWALAAHARDLAYETDTSLEFGPWHCGGTEADGSDASPRREYVKTWEIGGFKTGAPPQAGIPFDRSFVFFNGWFGGRGPFDCEPLQRDFSKTPPQPLQTYGAVATYTLRPAPCICE